MAHDAGDVAKVLAYGRRTSTPVTFRAGGTSLNGQGQSDGILVDVRRHFRGVAVEGDGARARVGPGTVLGHANRVLAPHGRKLGPDPASTDIACVGGVIANNSGGMRCGVTHDSYETVRELTFVLAVGDGDRQRRRRAPSSASPRPSPSSPPACWRSATRSAPTTSSPSGSGASSRSRTRPATGSARSSTPRRRWRSSAGCSSAPRARSRSSPRRCSRPCRSRPMTTVSWLHFPSIDAALAPVQDLVAAGARAVELMVAPALIVASPQHPRAPRRAGASSTRSRPRCWSSSAATTRPSSTPPRRAPPRCSPAAS